ncbi:hypothetical protein [Staphylococcus gallinarum]|nr:hypothetical protein [Staphylococcus gallinarum]
MDIKPSLQSINIFRLYIDTLTIILGVQFFVFKDESHYTSTVDRKRLQ